MYFTDISYVVHPVGRVTPNGVSLLGREQMDYDFCHSPEFFNNRPLYPAWIISGSLCKGAWKFKMNK